MAWGKAGSTTLGSAGDTITISSMTASKFNIFLEHQLATGNIDNSAWTFNNNTGSVYAYRHSKNGATDGTSTSQSNILYNIGDGAWDRFYVGYVASIGGEEKLVIVSAVAGNTSGAGSAPDRIEEVGKFVPSPDADITRIDDTQSGSGDYAVGSNLSVLGSDMTPAVGVSLKVQDGSIFYETDTNKEYVLNNGTWTEL